MRKVMVCLLGMILFLGTVFYTGTAEAREWTILGPRALGMGGAGVAVADDVTASYWNPAAYGFFGAEDNTEPDERDWSWSLGAGVGSQIHEDLGGELNKILQFDYDALDNGQIAADKVADFLQLVNELKTFDENKNRAATIFADGRFGLQVGHFGVGGYTFADISAKGDLDLVNIAPVGAGTTGTDLITQFSTTDNFNDGTAAPAGDWYFDSATKNDMISSIAGMPGWDTTSATNYVQATDYGLYQSQQSGESIPSDITSDITTVAQLASDAQTGGSFADNQSRLLFKGIATMEVPLTYGYAVNDNLAIGGNLKYMKARVYNTSVKIFNTDFGDALDVARKDYEDSQNIGVDLGLLYRFGDNLRVGMVGRNLNSPKFDMKRLLPGDRDYIREDLQLRSGFAYKVLGFLTLAADLDITKNKTTVSGDYKSQNLGGGVEADLRILKLRGGMYKNLAEDDIGLVYTAGIGLDLWIINLDLGASMASERDELDGNDYPKETRVELALSMLF